MQDGDLMVQILYRKLKGQPITVTDEERFDNWLHLSDSNRRIWYNLNDPNWVATAKTRYFAPGKEAGLIQLRETLFQKMKHHYPWYIRCGNFIFTPLKFILTRLKKK